MRRQDRRAERVAIVGLLAQLIFAGVLLALFRANNSPATLSASWFLLIGCGIWLITFIELYQRRLAIQQREELEELERERLAQIGGSESVFGRISPDEELSMEKRLKIIKQWIVPIFSLLIAGLLILFAGLSLPNWWAMTWITDALEGKPTNQLVSLSATSGIAFVCFVISRYCLGLSKIPGWRIVRAGANYTMGSAIVCLTLTISFALINFEIYQLDRILVKAIPILMIILSAEIVLNLILDIYRPRIPDEEYRPIYESRLLGLVCEPEGVMQSIAQAIDYQFGFKVSETWFYQFLQETISPLILFGVIVIYGMSTLVYVRPGYEAVVLRFGRKPDKIITEGLHFKLPWPIDKAYIYPVDEIKQLALGFSGESDWFRKDENKPILWKVKHVTDQEFQLLVASKHLKLIKRTKKEKELSPVSILAGVLLIHYNIKHDKIGLLDYIGNYENPEAVLEAVAYRQWTKYMASVDPMHVMTKGREKLTKHLRESIQRELNRNNAGINIIKVAIIGIHPPVDVAEAFEAAINARQEKETAIWQARGDANESVPKAKANAYEIISSAEKDKYAKVIIEQAKAERFKALLKSYTIAPQVFFTRKYLDVMVESTQDTRKYIIAVSKPEKILLIIDDKEKLPPGVLGLGEELQAEVEKQQK